MGIFLLCRNSGSVLESLFGTAPSNPVPVLLGVFAELFGPAITLVGMEMLWPALCPTLGGTAGGADLMTLLGRGGAGD